MRRSPSTTAIVTAKRPAALFFASRRLNRDHAPVPITNMIAALMSLWLPIGMASAVDIDNGFDGSGGAAFQHNQTATQLTGYQMPSDQLAAVVSQPKTARVLVSPDNQWLLLATPQGAPSVTELARPLLKLAGAEIDAERALPGRLSLYDDMRLMSTDGTRQLQLPGLAALMPITAPKFSPDGKQLALVSLARERAVLHFIDLNLGTIRAQPNLKPNFSLGVDYVWLPDSSAVVLPLTAGSHSDAGVSITPAIKQSQPGQAAKRTHTNLLRNAADKARFAAQIRSQLAQVSPLGKVSHIGAPGAIVDARPSPDGRFLLITELREPFSLRVPYRGFAKTFSVIELGSGDIHYQLQSRSSENEGDDDEHPAPNPRLLHWQGEANLVWAQSEPGSKADKQNKDPKDNNSGWRDNIWQLAPPFSAQPTLVGNTPWPIRSLQWCDDDKLLITQYRRSKQQIRRSLLTPATAKAPFTLQDWYQISSRDTYRDPGTLHSHWQAGKHVLTTRNGALLHYGLGYSDSGMRPFLKQTRVGEESSLLWQSEADAFEQVEEVISLSPLTLLIRHETPNSPPALYWTRPASGERRFLTALGKRQPWLEGVSREQLLFERADGQRLSGTLYLPAGYRPEQGPLPVLIWAYPREFRDNSVAGQLSFNPLAYPTVSASSARAMLASGIAVFDRVSMPIIGEGKALPNDNFIQQLTANAEAAVQVLKARGISDGSQIVIGGHSYGAFMVANLLAHTDLFAAGIARSGAYNRSLTPFGFQNERRSYWQAQSLYQAMSPFNVADKINEPLLLIHGEADTNSGTYPMQSTRLFDAVSTLGGNVRLVTLPFEGHSYRAKESLQHLLWEQEQLIRSVSTKSAIHTEKSANNQQSDNINR